MWDLRGSYYGPYAYAARMRRMARTRMRRQGRPRLRLMSVDAQVRPELRGVPAEARVFMADLFPRAIYLLTRRPFAPGMEISVTLSWPRQIFLRGRVVGCTEVCRSGKVIGASPFAHRLAVELSFADDAERRQIEEHVLDLRAHYLFDQPADAPVERE